MDCVFCKIAAGGLPSKKLYEDDEVLAFYDIAPAAPVHFLVIPKAHIASTADISADNSKLAARCLEVIAKLASELGLDGFRIISNCGENAGQTVSHLHFHVLSGKKMTVLV